MARATNDVFDDWARRGRAQGMERGHFVRGVQALEAIPLRSGSPSLDLGCGNGWAARWLGARTGGPSVGVDAAAEMVAEASRNRGEGLSFARAAFEALPFADGGFSQVFSMEALYYADELDVALSEAHRVLRPEGTLTVCTDFFVENPHCHDWPDKMRIPMTLLAEAGWAAAFERAGLSEVRTFRCLDGRPVDPELPDAQRRSQRHFREQVGALAIQGRA